MNKKLILIAAAFLSALFISLSAVTGFVFANSCERLYGGGLKCNESLSIKKQVRKTDKDEWVDSIKDVKKGETFQFRIEVKNTGDVDAEDLEMVDLFPSQMEKIDGSLTQDIDLLDNGTSKSFHIKAKIKDTEFDGGKSDCLINTAKIRGDMNEDGNKETVDDDQAVVCFGKGVTELPKTGGEDLIVLSALGLGMILTGVGIRRFLV